MMWHGLKLKIRVFPLSEESIFFSICKNVIQAASQTDEFEVNTKAYLAGMQTRDKELMILEKWHCSH